MMIIRARLLILTVALVAAPDQSSAQSKSSKANIRSIDFHNFTYRPTCEESSKSIRVRGREYSFSRGDDRLHFEIGNIAYGDLTGDGAEEAVVLTTCNTGGTGNFSEGFIYTMRNGRAALLRRIEGGDRTEGGFHDAAVKGRLLVIETYDAGEKGGACCPE